MGLVQRRRRSGRTGRAAPPLFLLFGRPPLLLDGNTWRRGRMVCQFGLPPRCCPASRWCCATYCNNWFALQFARAMQCLCICRWRSTGVSSSIDRIFVRRACGCERVSFPSLKLSPTLARGMAPPFCGVPFRPPPAGFRLTQKRKKQNRDVVPHKLDAADLPCHP